MTDLRSKFDALQLPVNASAQEKRKRGTLFEDFLQALFLADNLKPRIRFRPSGEELDGSFELDHRIYLLEAKWHAAPLPASAIYAFKGKVDGKLTGTIGIFISISGYSGDAIDALTAGKDINVLLVDQNDIEAAIVQGISRVLRAKIRAAAEEGVVFYPFTSTLATVRGRGITERFDVPIDEPNVPANGGEVVIICEGKADVQILNLLGQRILESASKSGMLRVVAAQGKHGIPRVANAIYPLLPESTPLIIVTDGDGEPEEAERRIREFVDVPFGLVIVNPEIEAWFQHGVDRPREEMRLAARRSEMTFERYVREEIKKMNLLELADRAPAFRTFRDLLLRGFELQQKTSVTHNLPVQSYLAKY